MFWDPLHIGIISASALNLGTGGEIMCDTRVCFFLFLEHVGMLLFDIKHCVENTAEADGDGIWFAGI